jgi:formamidopyrimidine-DNA glycosylase
MPEGPEILYWSVLLKKKLATKYKFSEIKSFTDKPIIIPKNWEGKIIDSGSKGKLLWLLVSGINTNYYMHIHYGITGWFNFDKPKSNIKFEFVLSNLKTNKQINLYMEDKRRFSKITICTLEQHIEKINKLGIDIFSEKFTLENFKNIIQSKNTMLAAFLLKQEIFCGIGNYIKNEVLYMGKLKVKIKTSDLTNEQIDKLYSDILLVSYSNLEEMLIDSNISKFLDKSKSIYMPKKLEIPYKYKIYARETTLDGKKVLKIKVAGRDTYCIKELC